MAPLVTLDSAIRETIRPTVGSGAFGKVTPATGLKSPQTVVVQASRFSAGESLVVTECAAKGTATQPGDCNLTGIRNVTADTSGRVRVGFTVLKGPFGANNIVCDTAQACLISVTQATLSPTEEADAPISFRLARGVPSGADANRDLAPGRGRGMLLPWGSYWNHEAVV